MRSATASSAGRPASRGSRESVRPSRRSTLRTASGRRSSASASVSVSVPTTTRCTPRSSSARARSGSLTPASTMTRASRASAAMISRLHASAGDRVEVGDVQLVEPEPARERERVAERAIAFALAAHGVNRLAGLQIDDSDDAHAGHASGGHRRREHEGRLARRDVAADGVASLRGLARPRRARRRAARDRRRSGRRGGDHDDRRAVRRVPHQARGRGVRARRRRGRVRRPERADDGRRAHLRGGGARAAVGRRRRELGRDGARGGRRAPRRAADRRRQHDRRRHPDRRRPGRRERAATTSSGCWRASSSTPACCARTWRRSRRACRCAAAGARWRRSSSRSAPTSTSCSGIWRTYDCPTPDGRPATVEFARERIARLVCSDVDQLDETEIDAIAAYLHGEQVRQIEEAARRVGARRSRRRRGLRRVHGTRGRRAPGASGRRRHGVAGRGAAALLAARLC